MKTKQTRTKKATKGTCKTATNKPEHPPPELTRKYVKTLPKRKKNALRAEALALVMKGQSATGGEALRLSEPDRARLTELIRGGMLPGYPPPPERVTSKRNAELQERAQHIIEGKPVSPFLRSETEAACVLHHLNERTKAILKASNDKLTKIIAVFREGKRRAANVVNKKRKRDSESLHKTLLAYYAEIHVADPFATEGAKVKATLDRHRWICAKQKKRDKIRTSSATFYRAKKEHGDYLQACIDKENQKHEGAWE